MISTTDLPVQDVLKGIKVERREMYDSYTGTQEALIAADLASEDMFPVWPKRIKRGVRANIPMERWWTIKRYRGAKFALTRRHEYRKLPSKPLTPYVYKKFMEINLGVFLDLVKGSENGLQLSNANDLEQRVTTLLEDIRAARVIRKPRLAVVK